MSYMFLFFLFNFFYFREGSIFTTDLYDVDVKPNQWPIVYSEDYNIKFGGLEKMHPFDSGKWGRIIEFLKGNESKSFD